MQSFEPLEALLEGFREPVVSFDGVLSRVSTERRRYKKPSTHDKDSVAATGALARNREDEERCQARRLKLVSNVRVNGDAECGVPGLVEQQELVSRKHLPGDRLALFLE